ncbi:MAG TPA: hypothetical protein VFO93_18845 [Hymenobacter sp.]|uniref:hypothetical protein n=1 Tax=Hymenobacter sp. TaxID=1898978 RepID=UPI002D7FE26A|nr:hypothetical protein [Hymenobacter sp.]HET9505609.1 hypothetical protein [Hymenobacter sp.]
MQQLYVLRRFSSWSFRLSVGVALLVSSAGLAASLLVGAALDHSGAAAVSWQPTGRAAQPASDLAFAPIAGELALPASLRNLVPAYAFAKSPTVATLVPMGANGPFHVQPAAAAVAPPPAVGSLKSTAQHLWLTFKQAFR